MNDLQFVINLLLDLRVLVGKRHTQTIADIDYAIDIIEKVKNERSDNQRKV